MEDLDEVRVPFGTVADFSNWNMGVKGFEHMKISSSEKIIEPEEIKEETITKNLSEVRNELEKNFEEIEENLSEVRNESQKKDLPNKETVINPSELKNIAIRLLPTSDKVRPGDYDSICERAIDLAYNFLRVWDLKVELKVEE